MSESNGHIPAGDLLRAELAQGRRRLDAMESQMLFWRSVAGILTAAGGGGAVMDAEALLRFHEAHSIRAIKGPGVVRVEVEGPAVVSRLVGGDPDPAPPAPAGGDDAS